MEPIGKPTLPGGEGLKHAPDISPNKLTSKTIKAEKTKGQASVETPWEGSHETTGKGSAHWQAHHANPAGLPGQTTWQHRNAKRGGDSGPEQRTDPWPGMNTHDGTDQKQSYT